MANTAINRKKPVSQKKSAPKRRPVMSLEKRIKAITLKEQETKVKVFALYDQTIPPNTGLKNAAGTLQRGLYINNLLSSATLSMGQGTSQQQRVGNSINNCRLNIKGFIVSNPQQALVNTSPYPFEVHIIAYKKKDDPNGDPNEILQYPNNTNSFITGGADSTLYPWNRKAYTIKKHKVFRMKANPITAISSTANAIGVENPSFNGAGPQFFRRFSFDVPIKDVLQFDDSATGANNDWLSLGVYVVNGDGVVMDSTANPQRRCKVTAFATLRYKDS